MEISEDKLYRIVTVVSGQYEGGHRIYWNKYIWSLFEKDKLIYKWGDIECLKAQAGDWIETYDGTVMQVLRIRLHNDKKHRVFHFFSFPIATVYTWTNKDNITKFRQLQGNFMNGNRNNMASGSYIGTQNQKVRFASLIIAGVNPLKAYRLAFNKQATMPISKLHRKVNQLMTDDIVRTEIVTQLQPLADKLADKFDDDRLLKELDLLLSNSRKGSDAHRENIKFLMALLNKLPAAMYPGSKKDKSLAVDAVYETVAPPQLGAKKEESL